MSTLLKFLQVAKELNIPCRNLTSTEDLKEAIKDTIMKYKEIIFDVDSSICIKLQDDFWKQQAIDKKVFDQKLIIDDAVTGVETGLEAPSGKHDTGW